MSAAVKAEMLAFSGSDGHHVDPPPPANQHPTSTRTYLLLVLHDVDDRLERVEDAHGGDRLLVAAVRVRLQHLAPTNKCTMSVRASSWVCVPNE